MVQPQWEREHWWWQCGGFERWPVPRGFLRTRLTLAWVAACPCLCLVLQPEVVQGMASAVEQRGMQMLLLFH